MIERVGVPTGRFPLGTVYVSSIAERMLQYYDRDPYEFVFRHHAGDWGETLPHQVALNETASRTGGRVHSVYDVSDDTQVWVLTDQKRDVTLVLLPQEYCEWGTG